MKQMRQDFDILPNSDTYVRFLYYFINHKDDDNSKMVDRLYDPKSLNISSFMT